MQAQMTYTTTDRGYMYTRIETSEFVVYFFMDHRLHEDQGQ